MFASGKGTGELVLRVTFGSEKVDVLLGLLLGSRVAFLSLEWNAADPIELVGVLTARDAHFHSSCQRSQRQSPPSLAAFQVRRSAPPSLSEPVSRRWSFGM